MKQNESRKKITSIISHVIILQEIITQNIISQDIYIIIISKTFKLILHSVTPAETTLGVSTISTIALIPRSSLESSWSDAIIGTSKLYKNVRTA